MVNYHPSNTRLRARFRPTDFPATDWAYLAAIVDGEGTIIRNRERWYLCVTTTDQELVNWLRRFEVGSFYNRPSTFDNLIKKPQLIRTYHRWQVTAMIDVWLLLYCLLPYLVIKRAKAVEAFAELGGRLQQARLHRRSRAV